MVANASEVRDTDQNAGADNGRLRCGFLDQDACGGMAALLADPTFTLGLLLWLIIITVIYVAMVLYILYHKKRPPPPPPEKPRIPASPPSLPPPSATPTTPTTPVTPRPVAPSNNRPLPSSAFSTWIGSLRDDHVMEWQNTVLVNRTG